MMRARSRLPWALVVVSLGCHGAPPERPGPPASPAPPAPSARLQTFGSLDALRAWIRALPPPTETCDSIDDDCNGIVFEVVLNESSRAIDVPSAGFGARVGGAESVTNTQVQGVDEGDIVKTHGDHLVVLRRGRLFSVRAGSDALTPVSMVDAFGRGRAPGGWYDEMLVDGDTLVVIGYSYESRSSEIGLFDIDAAGVIRWRDTFHLRSGDYYSSRNYASRLVGGRLVMYLPVPLRLDGPEPSLPSVRRAPGAPWEALVDAAHLYRPAQPVTSNPVAHAVLSCDLARGFDCRAVGVVGPAGRNFYVSGSAVYLWLDGEPPPASAANPLPPAPATLFRLPLDCGTPGAVLARGAPVDQFSFDESRGDLRVVVRAEGNGEGMWRSDATRGEVGLLRVPVARFSDELPTMERAAYRALPRVEGDAASMQNRFVGDRLLYGAGGGWSATYPAGRTHPVWVHDVARDRTARLDVSHAVDRIESLGRDALVVGHEPAGLTFSALALDDAPSVASRYTVPGAAQGETRSHGFFFRPEGDRRGTLGLAITRGGEADGWRQLRETSSAVVFLGVEGLRFSALGSLDSRGGAADDRCVASCADWYGNTRPIFWRGRVFALLGYELVEGDASSGSMRERRRVDFLEALRPANAPAQIPGGSAPSGP